MPSCPVLNKEPLTCEHGCCGSENDQKCCAFLSETVIIVVCAVGAAVVIAIVLALIMCMKRGHRKHRVRTIRQQHPRRLPENGAERRQEHPLPPPYADSPPSYDLLSPRGSLTFQSEPIPGAVATRDNMSLRAQPHPLPQNTRPSDRTPVSVTSNQRSFVHTPHPLRETVSSRDITFESRNRSQTAGSNRSRRRVNPAVEPSTRSTGTGNHSNIRTPDVGTTVPRGRVSRTETVPSNGPSPRRGTRTNEHVTQRRAALLQLEIKHQRGTTGLSLHERELACV